MKARDCRMMLVVLAASLVAAGCGPDYRKKFEEADARANQTTTTLGETNQTLEKAKAENARLDALIKQKTDQMAEIKAEAKKMAGDVRAEAKMMAEDFKAELKRLSDELKAARDQVAAITKELDLAKAKAKEAEQLTATIQKLTQDSRKLEQDNKQLQAAIDKLRSQAVPKTEPNAVPARGPQR